MIKSDAVTYINKGTIIMIDNVSKGNWIYASLREKTGWILRSNLKTKNNSSP